MTAWLRYSLRQRRGIAAACGVAEDVLTVCCCSACALAQHERELRAEADERAGDGELV